MRWTPSKIRELRIGLGWSAAQLSRRLQCKVEVVLDWEAGTSRPPEESLRVLDELNFHRDDCSQHTTNSPQAESAMKDQGLSQITRTKFDKT